VVTRRTISFDRRSEPFVRSLRHPRRIERMTDPVVTSTISEWWIFPESIAVRGKKPQALRK
jgi:hypothetical protein